MAWKVSNMMYLTLFISELQDACPSLFPMDRWPLQAIRVSWNGSYSQHNARLEFLPSIAVCSSCLAIPSLTMRACQPFSSSLSLTLSSEQPSSPQHRNATIKTPPPQLASTIEFLLSHDLQRVRKLRVPLCRLSQELQPFSANKSYFVSGHSHPGPQGPGSSFNTKLISQKLRHHTGWRSVRYLFITHIKSWSTHQHRKYISFAREARGRVRIPPGKNHRC